MKRHARTALTALLLAALLASGACTAPGEGGETAGTEAPTSAAEPLSSAVPDESTASPTPEPCRIGGTEISAFTLVYRTLAEAEEGTEICALLKTALDAAGGCDCPVVNDMKSADHEILVGNPRNRPHAAELTASVKDPYSYVIEEKDGDLYVAGGGTFGLRKAAGIVADLLRAGGIPAGYTASGTSWGDELFPLTEGADVRLMSNNVWESDKNKWAAIGENSDAAVRSEGLAAVYMAYDPDVICFQEMSRAMITFLMSKLRTGGRKYELLDYTDIKSKPYTCLIYRADRVELLDSGHKEFEIGNNGSKSYTWGLFRMKESGKTFIAVSTHWWHDNETNTPGSDSWREAQAALIGEDTRALIEKYACPVFVMGDYNCKTNSRAYQVMVSNGFRDVFQLASLRRDDASGYHHCASDGFTRESPTPYEGHAIDHIMLRNALSTRILVMDHAHPYFYIKLSDHYPVYTDAVLGGS